MVKYYQGLLAVDKLKRSYFSVMSKLKRCHKSKTMWWALLLVILGAIADNLSYLQSQINERYYGFIVMGIGIVTAVLRWNTTKPLDEM